jgi:hypothetical protein
MVFGALVIQSVTDGTHACANLSPAILLQAAWNTDNDADDSKQRAENSG